MRNGIRTIFWLAALAFLPISTTVQAESQELQVTKADRARIALEDASGTLKRYALSPLKLKGGSELTVISPERWITLGEQLSDALKETHEQYSKLFGSIPAQSTSVRLLDQETFFITTGAPRWTNAMYFRGQIMIPISSTEALDYDDLTRSVKHEYSHALVHSLSSGRCPGWLDEGLAQWAEGKENPAFAPALQRWLAINKPVSLDLLQGGFTRLDTSMVAAAYAQSLFAAHAVINSFGSEKISKYFAALRVGLDKPEAFQRAFGVSLKQFEGQLALALVGWGNKKL